MTDHELRYQVWLLDYESNIDRGLSPIVLALEAPVRAGLHKLAPYHSGSLFFCRIGL